MPVFPSGQSGYCIFITNEGSCTLLCYAKCYWTTICIQTSIRQLQMVVLCCENEPLGGADRRRLLDRRLQLRASELLQVTAVSFSCQSHMLSPSPADRLPLLSTTTNTTYCTTQRSGTRDSVSKTTRFEASLHVNVTLIVFLVGQSEAQFSLPTPTGSQTGST